MPLVPIQLRNGEAEAAVAGLVDSGAAINVLPFSLGIALGLSWEAQSTRVPLSGALSGIEARAVKLKAKIRDFPEVELVFAWCRNDLRLILGHMNFLELFNFTLKRKELSFELWLA